MPMGSRGYKGGTEPPRWSHPVGKPIWGSIKDDMGLAPAQIRGMRMWSRDIGEDELAVCSLLHTVGTELVLAP